MAKTKTKRICGLEWRQANWSATELVDTPWRRTLRQTVKDSKSGPAWEWIATRRMPMVHNITVTAGTDRAAVKKLLRLEERVLRELRKGRVE